MAAFRQKHIGFIFQSYNLLPYMTALENTALPLMFQGYGKKEREARAARLLKMVGLGERLSHYPSQMSGGQQQRVGIARAFAANPDVIFVVYMPYAGDDPETVKESQLAVIKDDEALQSLDAVKNGRVYPIMLSEMYASATRTQDGIETFAKGLYPDVNLD